MASDCADDDPCTDDACDNQVCVHVPRAGMKACNGQCVAALSPQNGCSPRSCTPCAVPAGGAVLCSMPDTNGDAFCIPACPQGTKLVEGACIPNNNPATGCALPGGEACPGLDGPHTTSCTAGGDCAATCSEGTWACSAGCCSCNQNGSCEPQLGEFMAYCADCSCGNSVCQVDRGETNQTCALDCLCGNGVCDPIELNSESYEETYCPQECACLNGSCDPLETVDNCAFDCDQVPPTLTLISPTADQEVNGVVVIRGSVFDQTLQWVGYQVDGGAWTNLQVQSSGIFEVPVDLPAGQHSLSVAATDITVLQTIQTVSILVVNCPATANATVCLDPSFVGTNCKTVVHRDACIQMAQNVSTPLVQALPEQVITQDFAVQQGVPEFQYESDGRARYVTVPRAPYTDADRMHYANPGSSLYSGTRMADYGYPNLPADADPNIFRVAAAQDLPNFDTWLAVQRPITMPNAVRWGLNGNQVRSCEEYVAEKYHGWTQFERSIKPILGDPDAQIVALGNAVNDPAGYLRNFTVYPRHSTTVPVTDVLEGPGAFNIYEATPVMKSIYATFQRGPSNRPPSGVCPNCTPYVFPTWMLQAVANAGGVPGTYLTAAANRITQLSDPAAFQAEEERQARFADLLARRKAADLAFATARAAYDLNNNDFIARSRMISASNTAYGIDESIAEELSAAYDRGCLDGSNVLCSFTNRRYMEAVGAKVRSRQEHDYERCLLFTHNRFGCDAVAPSDPSAPFICKLALPNQLGSTMYPPGDYRVDSAGVDAALDVAEAYIAAIAANFDVDPQTGKIAQIGNSAGDSWSAGGDVFGANAGYGFGWHLSNVKPNVQDTNLHVNASAYAGVRAFAVPLDLIRVGVSAETLQSAGQDKIRTTHALDILGVSVWGETNILRDNTWSLTASEGEEKSEPLAQAVIMIFAVPVTIKAGIGAQLGMDAGLEVSYQHVSGNLQAGIGGVLRPFFDVSGFLSVSVDLFIAEFGIKGSLSLLRTELPFTAGVYISPSGQALQLTVNSRLSFDNSTMSGKIVVFAKFLWWRAESALVKWEGLRDSTELFSTSTPPVDLVALQTVLQ